ncbi:hypothetical protein RUM43_001397 [Polyplax serrata]|uniref:Uncharacterized protein n=1 Tax=Polyplax serrata TaxID=468196 RepID=A0AAN8SI01_POLSC
MAGLPPEPGDPSYSTAGYSTRCDGWNLVSYAKNKRNNGQSSAVKGLKQLVKFSEGYGNGSVLGKENKSIAVPPTVMGCEFELVGDPTDCLNFSKTKYLECSPKVPVAGTASKHQTRKFMCNEPGDHKTHSQANNLTTVLKSCKS